MSLFSRRGFLGVLAGLFGSGAAARAASAHPAAKVPLSAYCTTMRYDTYLAGAPARVTTCVYDCAGRICSTTSPTPGGRTLTNLPYDYPADAEDRQTDQTPRAGATEAAVARSDAPVQPGQASAARPRWTMFGA